MRFSIATLALALTIPAAAAADMYAGRYSGACGDLVCELDVSPAGRDRWAVRWTATDPTDHDLRVLCELRTAVSIGSAAIGGLRVDGIAVATKERAEMIPPGRGPVHRPADIAEPHAPTLHLRADLGAQRIGQRLKYGRPRPIPAIHP